jgi:hypothetical protein
VESVYIADAENREYFKLLLKQENIPFELVVANGEKTMMFERSDSERVQALIDEYVGKELQPGRSVCYKDQEALAKETEKLKATNAPFKLVRNYEYTCIVWDKKDSEKVKSVIY